MDASGHLSYRIADSLALAFSLWEYLCYGHCSYWKLNLLRNVYNELNALYEIWSEMGSKKTMIKKM